MSWKCDKCDMYNEDGTDKCIVCGTLRTSKSIDKTTIKPSEEEKISDIKRKTKKTFVDPLRDEKTVDDSVIDIKKSETTEKTDKSGESDTPEKKIKKGKKPKTPRKKKTKIKYRTGGSKFTTVEIIFMILWIIYCMAMVPGLINFYYLIDGYLSEDFTFGICTITIHLIIVLILLTRGKIAGTDHSSLLLWFYAVGMTSICIGVVSNGFSLRYGYLKVIFWIYLAACEAFFFGMSFSWYETNSKLLKGLTVCSVISFVMASISGIDASMSEQALRNSRYVVNEIMHVITVAPILLVIVLAIIYTIKDLSKR